MAAITNRSLAIIKELLGNNKELHDSIEALALGQETAQDVDKIMEELKYFIERKRNQLSLTTLEDAQEAIEELRNLG